MGIDEQALSDRLSSGTVVGEYEIEAAIGQGGFGVVYRAQHRHLDTSVALKEYLPAAVAVRRGLTVSPRNQSVASDYEDGLRRFKEEARRLVQFRSHPGVVTCLGFFEERGTAYLVMEYEEGLPLSELLTSREKVGRPLEQGELLRLAERLLDSLATIHEAGVLHRDIKPSNILIRRGDDWPVLIDFGAAKQDFVRSTKSNAPHTEGYAAIEQLEVAGELGPWTDLYGLGAVLWRIVAGGNRPREPLVPVDAVSRTAAALRGQVDPLPSARALGSGRIANWVLDAIDKCLEVEPANRPSDCSELRGLLSVPVQEEPTEMVPNGSDDDVSEGVWGEGESANKAKPTTEDRAKTRPRRMASRSTLVGLAATLAVLALGLLWNTGRSDLGGVGNSQLEVGPGEVRRIQTAAEQGDADARGLLGRMYYSGEGVPRDYAEAAKWYRKAAEQGDADAQYSLAMMYFLGEGVPQDDAEGVEWTHKAAEQGDLDAQINLGVRYHRGWGVPQDDAEALKWTRKAVEQGDADAQGLLGRMYYSGEGVPQDHAEAAKWYRKAAEQGDGFAQVRLGRMYYSGEGVPRDYAEAAKLMRKAAEAGLAEAQYELSMKYYAGRGVLRSNAWAYAWMNVAAAEGYPGAEMRLDQLESEMTTSQIAEGQSLAQKIAAEISDRDR